MIDRRTLLASVGAASTVALAGCGCEMFPRMDLYPARDARIGPVDGQWTIRGDLYAEFVSPDSFSTDGFHDVAIRIESEQGDRLAQQSMEDVLAADASGTGDRCQGDVVRREFELVPGEFPYRIRVDAAELDLRCEEDGLTIADAVFNEYYDVGNSGRLGQYWSLESRQCPGE